MAKKDSPGPRDRELDLLKVMWTIGEARVRDIHEAFCPNGECAFTTVQTFLRIMCDKGLVKKRSVKRTNFYKPVYTLEKATSRFIGKLFDGSIDQFVLRALSSENISVEEMRDLEKMIAKARKSKQKQQGDK